MTDVGPGLSVLYLKLLIFRDEFTYLLVHVINILSDVMLLLILQYLNNEVVGLLAVGVADCL